MIQIPQGVRHGHEVVIFPRKYVYFPDGRKYWETPGNTGKYKISNNGLLVLLHVES